MDSTSRGYLQLLHFFGWMFYQQIANSICGSYLEYNDAFTINFFSHWEAVEKEIENKYSHGFYILQVFRGFKFFGCMFHIQIA